MSDYILFTVRGWVLVNIHNFRIDRFFGVIFFDVIME